MNTVCKIDGRGACGKIFYLPGGRKAVNIIRKQIQIVFQQLHKLPVVGHIPLPLQDLTQPHQFFLLTAFHLFAVRGLLILPMRRNTILRRLVHLKGADLYLKGLSRAADQRGMKRLIHVRLGHGDIILKPPGNRRVHLVDDSQRRVTVLQGVHNNPHREQIIDLIQGLALILHLLIDAEKVFDTAVHLGLYSGVCNVLADLVHNPLNILFPGAFAHCNLIHQVIVDLRLQIFQGEIVQFGLYPADAQSLGNGAVNLQRLPCNPLLALGRLIPERAHIMQSVSQLNHDDPDVLGHGKKHLAQVFRLHLQLFIGLIRPGGQWDPFQLGHAVHQQRHVLPKLPLQILLRHDGILHHVMEKPRHNGLLIQLQIRQHNGHIQGMNDIGLPRLAELVFMCLISHPVRLFDHGNIVAGMIFAHMVDQLPVQIIRISEFLRLINFSVIKDDLIFFFCHSCHHKSLQSAGAFPDALPAAPLRSISRDSRSRHPAGSPSASLFPSSLPARSAPRFRPPRRQGFRSV